MADLIELGIARRLIDGQWSWQLAEQNETDIVCSLFYLDNLHEDDLICLELLLEDLQVLSVFVENSLIKSNTDIVAQMIIWLQTYQRATKFFRQMEFIFFVMKDIKNFDEKRNAILIITSLLISIQSEDDTELPEEGIA
jgi:hypothetical protein